MWRKIGVMLSGLFLLIAMGCGNLNSTNANEESEKKQTTLAIQQDDQGISFTLVVENLTDQTMTLTFMSGKQYEIIVKDEDNQVVYNSSEGKMYTQAINHVKLNPNEKKEWTERYEGKLAKGKYTVEARVTASETNPTIKKEELAVKKVSLIE